MVLAGVAALLVLGAAGCGGSGGSSTAASSTRAANGAESTVRVSETDYKLDPSDPTIKPGLVTFDVRNDGQVVHSLEVEGPNGEQSLPSDLSPGQSGILSVDLSKPGRYEFYCPVGNHKQMGMEGTITVR
jgi:uncharacterized cupredoxin-like copper-binding protein